MSEQVRVQRRCLGKDLSDGPARLSLSNEVANFRSVAIWLRLTEWYCILK